MVLSSRDDGDAGRACRLEGYIFSTIALVLNYAALEMYVATPNTQHLRKVPVTPQHSRRQIQRGHTATGALTAPTPSQVQPFLGERSTPSSGQLTAESDRKLIRQLEEAIGGTRGLAVVARTLAMSHEKDGEAGLLLGAQQVSARPRHAPVVEPSNSRPGLTTQQLDDAHMSAFADQISRLRAKERDGVMIPSASAPGGKRAYTLPKWTRLVLSSNAFGEAGMYQLLPELTQAMPGLEELSCEVRAHL